MSPPINLDGNTVDAITMDGDSVSEVTVDGSAVFSAIPDSVVTRPTDDKEDSRTAKEGLEIKATSNWPSIGAELSANTASVSTAYLQDANGNQIQTTDVTGLSGGDAFTFNGAGLQSGNKYRILVDNDGASWTLGFRGGEAAYPYTAADVEITAFVENNDQVGTSNAVRALNNIGDTGF